MSKAKNTFTVDTDEQGNMIRFFNGDPPVRGDWQIICFLFERYLEAAGIKATKDNGGES